MITSVNNSPKPKGKRGRVAKSKSRNLLERLRDFEEDAPRFMDVVNVPFTNNQGKNDIRMTRAQQKISGCFRSMDGARIFWDGHLTHKSNKVKDCINSFNGRLEVYVLPSYSTLLNPAEQIWGNVKAHGTGRMSISGPDKIQIDYHWPVAKTSKATPDYPFVFSPSGMHLYLDLMYNYFCKD